jgi:nicotinamide mononucleotide transporter
VSTLEVVAVILGLACVGLTVRQHIACWPTGLAMVVLYIAVSFQGYREWSRTRAVPAMG